jgi:hypothetical protein
MEYIVKQRKAPLFSTTELSSSPWSIKISGVYCSLLYNYLMLSTGGGPGLSIGGFADVETVATLNLLFGFP